MLSNQFALYLQEQVEYDIAVAELQRNYLLATLMDIQSTLSGMGIKEGSELADVFDKVVAATTSMPNAVNVRVDDLFFNKTVVGEESF